MAVNSLKICSYNIQGLNRSKWEYLNDLVCDQDFVFVQEHWLHNTQAHVISDNLNGVQFSCVSGMDDNELISGRPFCGCVIIWKNTLTCKVE